MTQPSAGARTLPPATDLPRWLWLPAIAGMAFVVVPLGALFMGVRWSQIGSLLTSESARMALWLSVRTSVAATVLCLVVGVPMAMVLARGAFRGRALLRGAVLLPLVLPPVVSGIALLTAFGRRGVLGGALSALGIDIAFSTIAVVLAQAFVALPFLVLSLEGALILVGRRYADAAATLGASPTTVLLRVTLPVAGPALATGLVLSFARALGEFGATITFAGSLTGVTRTLPLEIYLQRETDPQAAVGLALLLVAVAIAVIGVALRRMPPR
ncbi:MAG: ABC transporter permease [Candidatus Nanopelagicales bacterium]